MYEGKSSLYSCESFLLTDFNSYSAVNGYATPVSSLLLIANQGFPSYSGSSAERNNDLRVAFSRLTLAFHDGGIPGDEMVICPLESGTLTRWQ